MAGPEAVLSMRQGFLSFAWKCPASCGRALTVATSSPEAAVRRADARPLHGLIWPEDGCASIA